ncbi:MAG: hypothetical protein ACLQJR_32360 [Stellaceae bacterium]
MTALIEHDSVVHELAELLIERYGERAASHAKHQSLRAAYRDEQRMMEAWRWIADAVEHVWKAEPRSTLG